MTTNNELQVQPVKNFIKTRVIPWNRICTRVLVIAKYPLAAFGTITLGLTTPYTLVILSLVAVNVTLSIIFK